MTFGHPIFSARETEPAAANVLDPTQAMAEVLSKYLECAVFRRRGGDAPDDTFRLRRVEAEWPDSSVPLDTPCASVTESTDTFHLAQFQPRPLEETLGVFDCMVTTPDPALPRTVLWQTAEAEVEFQVDFWTASPADRQAIAARLGYLLNPGQERTGVLLGGHPRYYDRAVRATLLSTQRMDNTESVYPNERRLKTMIRCQVDVVDLRIAVLLTPVATVEATDPSDPGATT